MHSLVKRLERRRDLTGARSGEGRNGADQRGETSSGGASVSGFRAGKLAVSPEKFPFTTNVHQKCVFRSRASMSSRVACFA